MMLCVLITVEVYVCVCVFSKAVVIFKLTQF